MFGTVLYSTVLKKGREYMKILVLVGMTLLALIGLSLGIAYITNATFMDYAFFIGLGVTGSLWFFGSKGGHTTSSLDAEIQGTTGFKSKEQKYNFSPNPIFFTSLIYTIIMFVALIYYYRNYF